MRSLSRVLNKIPHRCNNISKLCAISTNCAVRPFTTRITDDKLKLIKQLREITKEGVLTCKKILSENNWDITSAISHIHGSQESRTYDFDVGALKHGKIALCEDPTENITVSIELKCDCSFVSSSKAFADLCVTISKSIVKNLEGEKKDILAQENDEIIFIDSTIANNLPVYQDCGGSDGPTTIETLLRRVSGQFKTNIILDNIMAWKNTNNSTVGIYIHQRESSKEVTLGNRVGIIRVAHNFHDGEISRFPWRKIVDLLAMQLVASPLIQIGDKNKEHQQKHFLNLFMNQKMIRVDDINAILSQLCEDNNILHIPINSEIKIGDVIKSIESVIPCILKVTSGVYIHSGKITLRI